MYELLCTCLSNLWITQPVTTTTTTTNGTVEPIRSNRTNVSATSPLSLPDDDRKKHIQNDELLWFLSFSYPRDRCALLLLIVIVIVTTTSNGIILFFTSVAFRTPVPALCTMFRFHPEKE